MGDSNSGPDGGATSNPLIDPGTMCLNTSSAPGPTCNFLQFHKNDEITPIAIYMASEMNGNAHGPDVARMAELNGFSADACIDDFTKLPLWQKLIGAGITPEQCVNMGMTYGTAALVSWGLNVRQDGEWDHKPKIARRFHPRSSSVQHWHLYGYTLYYYDVWSNIHYGYVGTAAGFSASVLLDGAGLEQMGSTLLRGKLPTKSTGVPGLQAWDTPQDRAGIMMGINLYRAKPRSVTAGELVRLVTTSNAINKKPYVP